MDTFDNVSVYDFSLIVTRFSFTYKNLYNRVNFFKTKRPSLSFDYFFFSFKKRAIYSFITSKENIIIYIFNLKSQTTISKNNYEILLPFRVDPVTEKKSHYTKKAT